MAAQERVQDYLQRHRIGVLFEDLMAKIINDMPDEPTTYLARILQLRSEKKEGRTAVRKSGEFDATGTKKSYEKPWQTNTKRLKTKDGEPKTGKKTLGTRPEWDYHNKPTPTSFDEIWDDPKGVRKSREGRPRSPPGKPTAGGIAWADSKHEEGEDVMFSVHGYRGPRRGRSNAGDPLSGELGLCKAASTGPAKRGTVGKRGGRGGDSARSKAELQKYILDKQRQKHDSGIEDDRDTERDCAVELMEDADDLRREGVRNVKGSGIKMSRSMRKPVDTQANVRVSICARCAQVMGGGVPSEPAQGQFGEIGEYETDKAFATHRTPSARFGTMPSDDEFESVSQVTGPRRPVWQESDNEAVTPRKGKHMLQSNLSPNKGLPMYSGTSGQRKPGGGNVKSQDFQRHQENVNADPLRSTWSPAANTSGDYSERPLETSRTDRSAARTSRTKNDDDDATAASGLDGRSAGWHVPPDYDTESSFYGSPGGKKPQRIDRAY